MQSPTQSTPRQRIHCKMNQPPRLQSGFAWDTLPSELLELRCPRRFEVQNGNNAPSRSWPRIGSTGRPVDKCRQAEDCFTAAYPTTAAGRIRDVFTVLAVDRYLGGENDQNPPPAKHPSLAP